MIKSITIDNNENLPLKYSYKLESLKNGTKFDFIKGVNIIIGKNGSGKTSVVEAISVYLNNAFTDEYFATREDWADSYRKQRDEIVHGGNNQGESVTPFR